MSKEIIHKIDHHPGCVAIAVVEHGDWDTPWFIKGDYFGGDKAGGKRSTWHRWFYVRCNDPDCPALQLVSGNWLEKLVYLGAKSKSKVSA